MNLAKSLAQTKNRAHLKSKVHAKTKVQTKAYLKAWSKVQDGCENLGGVDSYGDGCDWYDSNPTGCGSYDTADWTSADACCACGGGDGPSTLVPGDATNNSTTSITDQNGSASGGDEGGCEDGSGVDSYGDGCDWYDANPDGCGGYDNDDFTSWDECCACGGSAEMVSASVGGGCEDGSGVDSYGDGCDWYDANPDGCGGYDTDDFSSWDECCACGGSADMVVYEDYGYEDSGDYGGECEDMDGVDSFGDGCEWYDSNPDGCGGYDTDDFVSDDQCCACGGGYEW